MKSLPKSPGAADILAIGFGTTATMWTVGYACRLFGDAVPAALIFVLVLATLVSGGVVVGRYTGRGALGGLHVGLLSGLVNLFIVGSLIGGRTPNEIKSGAMLWLPGTLVVSMVLASIGAALGSLRPSRAARAPDWPGALATVGACATFVLLAAGGLVTGFDEGLAVVDWPNTEGYNMFLYPLARMTGGVYLEHAHRLLGSLVGLTTLVLAIHVQTAERRRALKVLAWTALGFVVVQGILGGLRVTGRLTLSTQPADTDPNVALAAIHGVFGQIVFATLVALAVCRSRAWREAGARTPAISASLDRIFEAALVIILIGQLVLGALVRHFSWALDIMRYGLRIDPARLEALGQWALMLHVSVAVVVILLGVAAGVRAWGIYQTVPRLRRLGTNLLLLLGVQVALGVAALIMAGNDTANHRPTALDVVVTTAHQVVGAALLAWAVMLLLWNHRLLAKQSPAG
jgi:heme A synthase